MRMLLAFLFCCLTALPCWAGDTINEIKARQLLRCGVSAGAPGLAIQDSQGRWSGIEVDFCRAMAAAALEDTAKIGLLPLPIQGRFSSLLGKEVDLLARNTSQTIGRESQLAVLFAGPLFITGQSFAVHPDQGIHDLAGLNNASICIFKGTTHQQNIEDLAVHRGLNFQPIMVDSSDKAWEAFATGRCTAVAEDATLLAAARLQGFKRGVPLTILPGIHSRELISLVVRQADPSWLVTVRAVLSALITAEEIGLTGEMARRVQGTGDSTEVRIFMGRTDALATSLGLTPGWARRVIAAVGNYGELYERNLGAQGPLQLERGPNRLVRDGGMLYAVPF